MELNSLMRQPNCKSLPGTIQAVGALTTLFGLVCGVIAIVMLLSEVPATAAWLWDFSISNAAVLTPVGIAVCIIGRVGNRRKC